MHYFLVTYVEVSVLDFMGNLELYIINLYFNNILKGNLTRSEICSGSASDV